MTRKISLQLQLPFLLFIVSLTLRQVSCQLYEKEVENLEKFLVAHLDGTIESPDEYNRTSLPDFSAFKQVFHGFGEVVKVRAMCYACEVYIALLIHQVKMGASRERLEQMTYTTCTTFNLSTPPVCRGVVERLGPTFYFIIQNRPEVTPKVVCGLTFQNIGCTTNNHPYLDFKIDIDEQKEENSEESYEKLKILHFTDLHLDIDYVVNSSAVCDDEVLCCHGEMVNNASLQAGEYGDSRSCDAPAKLLANSLDFSKKLDADVMYMTGDVVPHNIWYSTVERNTDAMRVFSDYLKSHYPNQKMVFCIGNHEPHPVNLYSPEDPKIPEELRTNWIFGVTYEYLKDYVPIGYKENNGNYVVKYKKLKIIVINTNVCYTFNIWQLYDPHDPFGVLKFLNSELKKAETNKEYVHIVGHVPPGHEDCNNVWSREFYNIVNRYKDTIKAQFYGHTHFDEFKLYSDTYNKRSFVSIAYIGPSVTSYRMFNPGVKVYESYGSVENFTSYVFDYRSNEWTELYNSHELGVTGDSQTMGKFVYRMAKDLILFKKFYRYYNKGLQGQEEECDNLCRKRILCSLVRSNYGESHECNLIQKEVDGVVLPIKVLEEKKRRIWL